MSQQELLKKVVDVLNKNSIDYMITGSIVSSLQGEPRATHDIDIVVLINKNSIKILLQSFSFPDYFLDEGNIIEAIQNKSTFNLINVKEGDKVDFWILTDEPFDKSRFERKVKEEISGTDIFISSPEDTIIAKLRWAKLSGGSLKQFIDALRVYEIQYDKLNIRYIETWIHELSLEELWKKLKNEAEPYL